MYVTFQLQAMEVSSTRVMGTPSSKARTPREVWTLFKEPPLKLIPPTDLANCKISDNMEDCCKTLCKVSTAHSLGNLRF